MPRISQQAIADSLGLSKATVSRCFSNHPGISPETRSKVFQTASEMGYQPLRPRTRSGTGSKTMTRIAMVACVPTGRFGNEDFDDPGSAILEGLNEIALVNDWNMETHFIDPLKEQVGDSLKALFDSSQKDRWDGLLLVYPFPPASLEHLVHRLPCVAVMEDYGHRLPLDSVDVDSRRGIALMVDRLVESGHQQIGFYSETYPINPTWVLRRYSAYAERMAHHNLRPLPENLFGVYPDTRGEDRRYLDEVAERASKGMTALVCAADHQAYPVIERLRQEGLEVPRDFSLTGFDGIPVPKGMPRLTSIRAPHKEIGVAAMHRLSTLLQLRSFATRHIHVECSESPGESITKARN